MKILFEYFDFFFKFFYDFSLMTLWFLQVPHQLFQFNLMNKIVLFLYQQPSWVFLSAELQLIQMEIQLKKSKQVNDCVKSFLQPEMHFRISQQSPESRILGSLRDSCDGDSFWVVELEDQVDVWKFSLKFGDGLIHVISLINF